MIVNENGVVKTGLWPAGSKIIKLGREVVARLVSSSRDLDGIVSMINQV